MKLREVMSSRVLPVRMNDLVDSAARWMADHRVTSSPVLDDQDQLVGIITASKLEVAWLENQFRPRPTFLGSRWGRQEQTVGQLMSTPVASLTPGGELAHAAQILEDRRVPCVLIVDGFSVVGIINREDLP